MAMTRAQLNQAFREVASMEFADIPCDEETISFAFSDNFIQKMDKLIARQKKSYWTYVNTAQKRVAIVVIAFISLFSIAFSNEEIRASMLQWCADVFDEYIYYYFEGDTTKEITHEYQLTMVPEGFEKVYEQRDIETVIIGYENEVGDCIQFEQQVTEGYGYFVDNEKLKWSNVIVDGMDIKIYENTDIMGAIWIEDGYSMRIAYYGCKDIEIIKEMVRTIK